MEDTPIVYVPMEETENQIYVKRDDLIPFSFGGNKVRIAREFLSDMKEKKKNCMIGYGNARSNLSRALANLCYAEGVVCHIISPADDDGSRFETANSRMVKSCGVKFHECSKQNVAETVKSVVSECEASGLLPYYIYGNEFGKGNEAVPVRAYAKAYSEIQQQAAQMHVTFDYIFLATGTGMTQSGLLAGQSQYGGKEAIVGISVAREAKKETAVIEDFIRAYADDQNLEKLVHTPITVTDEYLCGGYGASNTAIQQQIMDVFCRTGIPLDPTYTGKAFYGMCEYLKKKNIRDKKVLFIHTGGTPLFFDFLKTMRPDPEICHCNSVDDLGAFLQEIDTQLPTSLSSRVNLAQYARKVIQNGYALTIKAGNKIVSSILFYCNDYENGNAYATLLGTLRGYEGRGYGRLLMLEMEKVAKSAGMHRIYLDTEPVNSPAIALYCRCGYKIENFEEKIHMVKEI